jgi:hypothetical protein
MKYATRIVTIANITSKKVGFGVEWDRTLSGIRTTSGRQLPRQRAIPKLRRNAYRFGPERRKNIGLRSFVRGMNSAELWTWLVDAGGAAAQATAVSEEHLTSPGSMKRAKTKRPEKLEKLMRPHEAHLGLYRRLSKKLSFDPAYISRVARGERRSEKIETALLAELRKLQ